MPHVFISHSTQDDHIADLISNHLRRHNITTWLDHQDLSAGDDWDKAIQDALNSSELGLLILSKSSATSAECRNEWRTILDAKKRLLVILVESISREIFPYRLRTVQYIDAIHNVEDNLERLVEVIGPNISVEHQAFDGPITDESLIEIDKLEFAELYEGRSHLLDIQLLRRSWAKALTNAKQDAGYFDSFGYSAYQQHIEANLLLLLERLNNNTFSIEPLYTIVIPKGEKKRQLFYAPPETNLVLQAVTEVMGSRLETLMSDNSYANRLAINDHFSTNIFQPWHEQYTKFQVDIQTFATLNPSLWWHRTDIAEFYPSINKERMISVIDEVVNDPLARKILIQLVNAVALNDDNSISGIRGIPAGVPISHVLANLYLNNIDKEMSTQAAKYFRYVDDVVFFGDSKAHVHVLQSQFEELLQKTGPLRANFQKAITDIASNVQRLAGILDELSGVLAFSAVEAVPDQQKQEMAKTFHSLFINTEGIDDPKDIAKYVGMAIQRMHSWGYHEEELDKIALDILRAAPLKPNQVRTVIFYLFQRNMTSTREFLEVLITCQTHIKIIFLQMLRSFEQIDDHIWSVVIDFLQNSHNIYLRGEAALALTNFPHKNNPQLQHTLDVLLSEVKSLYVEQRILSLSLSISNRLSSRIRIMLGSNDSQQQKIALNLIEQSLEISNNGNN